MIYIYQESYGTINLYELINCNLPDINHTTHRAEHKLFPISHHHFTDFSTYIDDHLIFAYAYSGIINPARCLDILDIGFTSISEDHSDW